MRVILLALLVTFAACGKTKESLQSPATKTTETKPADTEAAKPADTEAAKPADPAPATPPPAAQTAAAVTAVDTCAFFTKDDVGKLMGAKVMGDPRQLAAQGSMLGSCMYVTEKGGATVQAHPAGEFDGTAAMDKAAKDLAGVGEKAKLGKYGAFVQPAGKPYFMQVMVTDSSGNLDEAKTTQLSKLAAAGAK